MVSKSINAVRLLNQLLELSLSNTQKPTKKAFQPRIVSFLNEENVPAYLKKDVLIHYIKNYTEHDDLKSIKFEELIKQIQQ